VDYIIVGTDHNLQNSCSQDVGLRDLLQSLVATHPVVLIAEEVKTSEKVRTFGRELVGSRKWLSIDMTKRQKKKAGIYDILRSGVGPVRDPATGDDVRANPYHKKSEGVKENFWLDKIERWCEKKKVSVGTVVITCGHNHLDFLAVKAEMRGHAVTKREYLPYDKEAKHGLFTIYDD
jgi:hypothetical protein